MTFNKSATDWRKPSEHSKPASNRYDLSSKCFAKWSGAPNSKIKFTEWKNYKGLCPKYIWKLLWFIIKEAHCYPAIGPMGEMGKVARGELPADAIRPVPSKMSGPMNTPDTISIKPAQTQPIDKPDMLLVTKKEPEKSLVSSYKIMSLLFYIFYFSQIVIHRSGRQVHH